MAGVVIDRFRVLNDQRGKATIVASFDVKLSFVTIRGYEIVKVGNKDPFIAVPANAYKKSDGSGWDRFNFIVYEGSKGEQLQAEIERLAMEELRRRSGSVPAAASGGFEADLPF